MEEVNSHQIPSIVSIRQDQFVVNYLGNTGGDIQPSKRPSNLYIEIFENSGAGQALDKRVDLGRLEDVSSSIMGGNNMFSGLKKNTRYVAVLHLGDPQEITLARACVKTRGEFSNEEAGFQSDGTLPRGPANRLGERGHIVPVGGTGCFRVARTRQDIRDCMCNGTRGGTRILAGQTTGSQQRRQEGGCPDLDS